MTQPVTIRGAVFFAPLGTSPDQPGWSLLGSAGIELADPVDFPQLPATWEVTFDVPVPDEVFALISGPHAGDAYSIAEPEPDDEMQRVCADNADKRRQINYLAADFEAVADRARELSVALCKANAVIARIGDVIEAADAGDYATKSRDFGRGVAHLSREIRRAIEERP